MSDLVDPTDLELIELIQSPNADDRVWAAQHLPRAGAGSLSALRSLLDDCNRDVRGVAAQSLALARDAESMPKLLSLLDEDDGQLVRPLAWAVWALASEMDDLTRERAEASLRSLRRRGTARVVDQVDRLLEGSSGR